MTVLSKLALLATCALVTSAALAASGSAVRARPGVLAYVAASGEIRLVGADGSYDRALTHARDFFPDSTTRWFAWSRDGTQIVLWRTGLTREINRVYVMNATGTHVRRLGYGTWPAWSPNGRQVAFISGRRSSIFVANADGSDRHRLTTTGEGAMTHAPETNPLVWSPAKKIVFEGADHRLQLLDPTSGRQRYLMKGLAESFFPAPSPDGRTVAFTTMPFGVTVPTTFTLATTSISGADTKLVTHGPDDIFASWSPHGDALTFVRSEARQEQSFEVYVVDRDGAHLQRLTRNKESDFGAHWSPDGRLIVASRTSGIYVIDVQTRRERRITDAGREPEWNPISVSRS